MDQDVLRSEARHFSRYLIDVEPSEELIERYCRANQTLFEEPSPADRALLDFARRHPWSIAMLDAGAGLRSGAETLLRRKLVVMMAILETTPEHAARTEPRAMHPVPLVLRLGVRGALAVAKAAAGLALSTAITRGKS